MKYLLKLKYISKIYYCHTFNQENMPIPFFYAVSKKEALKMNLKVAKLGLYTIKINFNRYSRHKLKDFTIEILEE